MLRGASKEAQYKFCTNSKGMMIAGTHLRSIRAHSWKARQGRGRGTNCC